jgi:cation-transporting ATPase 13A1
MEKTTLDALEWQIARGRFGKRMPFPGVFISNVPVQSGDHVSPISAAAPHRTVLSIRRRFQFSSALKRMSTISTLPNNRVVIAVKGAPETIKTMLRPDAIPEGYDETYKYFTRRGSRVLALGIKEGGPMGKDEV